MAGCDWDWEREGMFCVDWDCDREGAWPPVLPRAWRGTAPEVSMDWVMSNSSFPSWRLSEPSDHLTIRLLDCLPWKVVLAGSDG